MAAWLVGIRGAGVEYPGNWHELLAWFRDDGACLRYLERLGGAWAFLPFLRDV